MPFVWLWLTVMVFMWLLDVETDARQGRKPSIVLSFLWASCWPYVFGRYLLNRYR